MTTFRKCDNCNNTIRKNDSYYTITIEKHSEKQEFMDACHFTYSGYSSGGHLDYCESCTKEIYNDLWNEVNEFANKDKKK